MGCEMTYLFFARLGFGLAGVGNELGLEHIFKFFGKGGKLRAIQVLDVRGSHDRLEKLTLKNDSCRPVHIFGFNAKLLGDVRLVLVLALILLFKV